MRLWKLAAFVAFVLAPLGTAAQDFDGAVKAYDAGDYVKALREWLPLAEAGNAEAQYNVGVMYAVGRGVVRDDAEAVRWYRLAAEQGNTTGQFLLGGMYDRGEGVVQDDVTAHMWYNIVGASGNLAARMYRDRVRARMSPADVSIATQRAKVCVASGYKDCD